MTQSRDLEADPAAEPAEPAEPGAPGAFGEPAEPDAPDAHGKFSLGEDWTATIAGLVLLALCLAQVVPNIGGWL